MKRIGICQEWLKLIACITMLIDHIGASLYPYIGLRIIGRLSFPIYCFLLCQGFRHTRSKKNYLLRLGISMVISEIPFDLLFSGGLTWNSQSVMVTLFLGVVMAMCMERTQVLSFKLLLAVPFALLAELLRTDYGGIGVLMIALFHLTEEHKYKLLIQMIGLILLNRLLGGMSLTIYGIQIPIQLFAVFSLVPIALYSGRKATKSRVLQWCFYAFYPAHLAVLLLTILFLLWLR